MKKIFLWLNALKTNNINDIKEIAYHSQKAVLRYKFFPVHVKTEENWRTAFAYQYLDNFINSFRCFLKALMQYLPLSI